jgi:hypothetical protein
VIIVANKTIQLSDGTNNLYPLPPDDKIFVKLRTKSDVQNLVSSLKTYDSVMVWCSQEASTLLTSYNTNVMGLICKVDSQIIDFYLSAIGYHIILQGRYSLSSDKVTYRGVIPTDTSREALTSGVHIMRYGLMRVLRIQYTFTEESSSTIYTLQSADRPPIEINVLGRHRNPSGEYYPCLITIASDGAVSASYFDPGATVSRAITSGNVIGMLSWVRPQSAQIS